ncbi:hypothetical protein H632_c3951p0, partial [Helicosporidium sp. ATCC 50920]
MLSKCGRAVEPSPSTSLMTYPVPLFHASLKQSESAGVSPGSEGVSPSGVALGGAVAIPAWAVPPSYGATLQRIAKQPWMMQPKDPEPLRLGAGGESQSPSDKDRPRREGAANEDGYNWRKYGEKTVRNSVHPRSYY